MKHAHASVNQLLSIRDISVIPAQKKNAKVVYFDLKRTLKNSSIAGHGGPFL